MRRFAHSTIRAPGAEHPRGTSPRAPPPRRPRLAHANAARPSAVFPEFSAHMVKPAHRRLRRRIAGATCLIDPTHVRLSALCAGWGRFSAGA